jgi:hypothetical protein
MIDRESIKSKIRLAIQQLPSQGVVYREKLDDYNSKIGLEEIVILEGLFYTSERASLKDLKLIEAGILPPKERKAFLTVWDENSMKVKEGDLLLVENNYYKIVDTGEDLQIYCEMELLKYEVD